MSPPRAPRVASARELPRYSNRELSWLAFNRRVLELASHPTTPLLERLRFLTISSTNLDEFFEVRVAGLAEQVAAGVNPTSMDGMSAQQTLDAVRRAAHNLVADQYALYDTLRREMAAEGVIVLEPSAWGSRTAWIRRYFRSHIMPVLTPIGLDPAHPFPRVPNKSLNFIVALEGQDAFGRSNKRAVLQAPRSLPRLIPLPSTGKQAPAFVLLSDVLIAHVGDLFPGMTILGCYPFRATRNSHLWVDEDQAADLLDALAGELPRRHYGASVRLEIDDTCPETVVAFLLGIFGLSSEDVYRVPGPVNLHRLEELYGKVDRPELKYPPHQPCVEARLTRGDMFRTLRRSSVLLHHPYDGFASVLRLLRQAAADPAVVAVKMTLYRTGAKSPVVEALLDCCEAGKDVTVVVELRARFDEAANIDLATRLQDAGANLVYGVVGYKTHAKLLLVVRRHQTGLETFVHMGTGNYHPGTAGAYTDVGYLTHDRAVGNDVQRIFQQLTGLGRTQRLGGLWHSPFTLHKNLLTAIHRERRAAGRGEPAHIMVKTNSLSERALIDALYAASQAGVKVDLIVRGICCLVPGVPGLSENIRVRSVLGRFLEHTRLFYFFAGGEEQIWCSSADWMSRNMFRRIEVAFSVEEPEFKKRLREECFDAAFSATSSVWDLQPDGSYVGTGIRPHGRDAQTVAASRARARTARADAPRTVFDVIRAKRASA